jgi:hypothetical protein
VEDEVNRFKIFYPFHVRKAHKILGIKNNKSRFNNIVGLIYTTKNFHLAE